MSTQGKEYQKVKALLMPQMKKCRDKDVRVKVELLLSGLKLGNVRLACERMGFGKSFFYKWWNRLVEGKFKIKALSEKTRKPKHSPARLRPTIEQRIRYYRKKGFGAEMIQQYLLREGFQRVSTSVIHHVICRRKPAVKVKKVKLKKHRKRYELPVPGQRLQIDVKYSPMPVAGATVFIYVAVDECTRWRFAYAYPAVNEHWTSDFLDKLKLAVPFPIQGVQTDNGHEFTFKLLGFGSHRTHLMETWCMKYNIPHRLIPPGVKELNGKVERSHRIDADYFYGSAPTASLALFNRALERWIRRYNVERPHGGIGYLTPVEKLRERITTLNNIKLEDEREKNRIRFISSVKLVKVDDTATKVAA